MKGITGYLVSAIVLAALATVLLEAGSLDRDMARAQEQIATGNYLDVEPTYDTAERYYEYASHVPWIGTGPANDVRARKAALHYWQKEYGAIVPQQTDPIGAVAADNPDLQLIVADAVYRTGQAQSKDKETTIQALDQGISAYLAVLKNTSREEDAAFNYEYLIRLRDEVDKGKRKGPADSVLKGPDGAAGQPPTIDSSMSEFKIYIPLESQERQEQGVAGKAAPGKRKG